MKKFRSIVSLIILVALIMINSLIVIGAEGEELGSWETKASMPTVRSAFGVAEVNGKIYAIGGKNTNSYLNAVEEYNTATNMWVTKASMPTGRNALGVAEVNGKIYAIGGRDENDKLNIVEEYSPETDTWIAKANMPTGRFGLDIVAVNNKIYAIGGRGKVGNAFVDLNVVEEYDPATDVWTTKKNLPIPLYEVSVVESQGNIYAFSGYNATNGYNYSILKYSISNDLWEWIVMPYPTQRSKVGAEEIDGKIYIIGGWHNSSIDTVEEYNIETNKWETRATMPSKRHALGVAKVNGKIYAIGGSYNNDTVNVVEVFTPISTTVISSPTNLTATPNVDSITLNWDAVNDTDSYTILRSTTSGTIDTVIATNVTDTTYLDNNVTPGVTYYYVVRAVKSGVESADSNIASAMIEISNNRALLLIKLLDENDKEYDLAMSDVDTFMNWYFDRGTGQGLAYYTFTKDYNTGPYISRKDYISYDKIICIEVNEYTK